MFPVASLRKPQVFSLPSGAVLRMFLVASGVALLAGCGDDTNAAPLASATCGAGTRCRVLPNGDGNLDARGSTDADDDVLAFRWYAVDSQAYCPKLVDCPCGWSNTPFQGFIRDTGSALTTFRAPPTPGAQLIFQVEVSDAEATARACSIYIVDDL